MLHYSGVPVSLISVLDACAKKPCKNEGEVCTLVNDVADCSCPDGKVLDGNKCVDGEINTS